MFGRNATVPAPVQVEDHGRFWEKLIPYGVQWAGWALAWPVAALAHNMWSAPNVLPWVTMGMAVVSSVLTYSTWQIVRQRPSLQWHATVTVVVGALWMTAATIVGPFTRPVLDLWLMGGPALVLTWNIRRMVGRGREGTKSEPDGLTKAVRALKKTEVLEIGPNKVVAELEAATGHTADDLVSNRGKMAAVVGVGANRIRVRQNPDDHSRATAIITPRDMLKEPAPWPGLSSPGGCITEPLVVGCYEDGEPMCLWLAGDPTVGRNTTHLIVIGMSGSGKSHGAKFLLAEILSRRNCALAIADPAKGLQTIGDVARHAAWAEITKSRTMSLVDQLMTIITDRTNQLAAEGLDEWTPESSMPFQVVWIEEASVAIRDSEELIDVAQTARSAGVSLVLSLQRPSVTNLPVEVRQQFGAVWCFGVSNTNDATFVLDEEIVARGADPSVWKNLHPGYSYLVAPGIPEDRHTTPGRTFGRANAELAAAMEESKQWRPDGLGPVTEKAAGKAYQTRPQFTVDDRGRTVELKGGRKAANQPAVVEGTVVNDDGDDDDRDDVDYQLLSHAAELIIVSQFGSTSMLQRKLRVNQATATDLMRQLEALEVVGPQPEDLDQVRPVLVKPDELDVALAAIHPTTHGENTEDDDMVQPAGDPFHGRRLSSHEDKNPPELPDNPEPDLEVDADEPLPPVDPAEETTFKRPQCSREEAMAALRHRLNEIKAGGASQVGPKDIGTHFFETVRVRSWVSSALSLLAMSGELVETNKDGVYLFPDHDNQAA